MLRIREAAAAGEAVIIVEDDLMPGGSPEFVRDGICRSIRTPPPTADMIYLEYCLESCVHLAYNDRYPRLGEK